MKEICTTVHHSSLLERCIAVTSDALLEKNFKFKSQHNIIAIYHDILKH